MKHWDDAPLPSRAEAARAGVDNLYDIELSKLIANRLMVALDYGYAMTTDADLMDAVDEWRSRQKSREGGQ